MKENRLEFPIYTDITDLDGRRLDLGGTPATLLIARGGRIVRFWAGAYSGKAQAEIEKIFDIRLPGLILDNGLQ